MERTRTQNRFPIVYSAPFLIAAGLSVLILITDKNLQTDFGSVSSGYFDQWYLILATAVADVVGAILLLVLRSRRAVPAGVIGSASLAVLLLAGIFTYQQVGFASAGQMANYLFGITYYGGDIRYLYDILLATYVVTFLGGVVGLVATRSENAASESAQTRTSTSG
ncbi:MAG TPA: hypothetical protein VEG66_01140 [Thermoplasmata archaeon]|nr:hypothetical protein [Thermoplasmata archaeon]